jgi:hypothetical protein
MKRAYEKPQIVTFGALESLILSGNAANTCHTLCPY